MNMERMEWLILRDGKSLGSAREIYLDISQLSTLPRESELITRRLYADTY